MKEPRRLTANPIAVIHFSPRKAAVQVKTGKKGAIGTPGKPK
jgi:hypothetical protein